MVKIVRIKRVYFAWSYLMSPNRSNYHLNSENFSVSLLHVALENVASTDPNRKNALVADEYPQTGKVFARSSSFYRCALDFCAAVILESDIKRKNLIDNKQEDVIPVLDLISLYPQNTELEVSILWLMLIRSWDEFKMQVERDNLRKVLGEVA